MTSMSNTPPTPRTLGRPSNYTPELGLAICQALAEGQSLRSICRAPDAPDKSTVMRWLHAHAGFREQYLIARDIGMDALADEALADATEPMRAEDVQAARLQFDARRWYVGKIAPKRWGDKVVNEHTGVDGGAIQLQATPTMMVPKEVAAGIKALLTKSEQEMGLPAGTGSDQERLRAILQSGELLSPDLYEALHGGGGRNDG